MVLDKWYAMTWLKQPPTTKKNEGKKQSNEIYCSLFELIHKKFYTQYVRRNINHGDAIIIEYVLSAQRYLVSISAFDYNGERVCTSYSLEREQFFVSPKIQIK